MTLNIWSLQMTMPLNKISYYKALVINEMNYYTILLNCYIIHTYYYKFETGLQIKPCKLFRRVTQLYILNRFVFEFTQPLMLSVFVECVVCSGFLLNPQLKG